MAQRRSSRLVTGHGQPCGRDLGRTAERFRVRECRWSGDPKGIHCPVGAHIRRVNPRGQPIAGQGVPGGSNNSHRLIRRGLPYGPTYDPGKPYEGVERGMLFQFINANIENQYEFVLRQLGQRQRIRRGRQASPKIEGSADQRQYGSGEHLRATAGTMETRRSRSQGFRASLRRKQLPTCSCRASRPSNSSQACEGAEICRRVRELHVVPSGSG